MALSPYETDALMREVDEAVRQDDMANFWLKYGRLILVGIVVALAAFGGFLYWQHHRITVAQANSVEFATLLKSAEGGAVDKSIYDAIMADGSQAYRTEAQLVKAALAAGKDGSKDAIADYDAILNDPKALAPMKQAALIRRTTLAFDTMKPQDVVAALKDLAVPGHAWFGSAGELTAIALLKMDKRAEAGKLFASIAQDPLAPETVRQRAGQMASSLGTGPQATGAPAQTAAPAANTAGTAAPAPDAAAPAAATPQATK